MAKKCRPGISFTCGQSCVTEQPNKDGSKRKCRVGLSNNVNSSLTKLAQLRLSKPQISGANGDVYFTDTSVYKVPKNPNPTIAREVELQKLVPSAPKIIAFDPETQVIEMERVRGDALWEWVADKPPAQVKEVLKRSVDTLKETHLAGVRHGDWRGPNQIITPEGKIVPIDFGSSVTLRKESGEIDWVMAAFDLTAAFGYDNLGNGFNLDRSKVGWSDMPDAYRAGMKIASASDSESQKSLYLDYVDQIKAALS
jgi:predicted Ser/Thr protein kinase